MAQTEISPIGAIEMMLVKYKRQIQAAIPEHLTPERLIRIALTTVAKNPKLQKCHPSTIVGAVIQSSQLGLECDGVLGEAFLIPYRNDRAKIMECQFQVGYKGIMKLVRNSDEIDFIDAQAVHEKDEFDFEKGLTPYLRHKRPKTGERGPVIGYWAGYVPRKGTPSFEYMTLEEVIQHRNRYSKAFQAGVQTPWKSEPGSNDFDWMAKKTVLIQALKLAPKSVRDNRLQTAIDLTERSMAGVQQQFSADVPIEFQPLPAVEEPEDDMPRRQIAEG